MSLFIAVLQYVDECRCLADRADSIHEKVDFIVKSAAAFCCVIELLFVFNVLAYTL